MSTSIADAPSAIAGIESTRPTLMQALNFIPPVRFNNSLGDSDDSQFHDFFGDQLGSLSGFQRWALVGPGKRIWENEIQPLIPQLYQEKENKKYIYKKYKSTDVSIINHCWMFGKNKSTAYPTIIVACNIPDVGKRAGRVIRKVPNVNEHNFKVAHFLMKDLTSLASSGDRHSHLPISNNFSNSPSRSLCGVPIIVSATKRTATLGGVVIAGGDFYGLTVAHTFLEDAQLQPYQDNENKINFIDDSDEDDDDDDEDDDDQDEEDDDDYSMDKKGGSLTKDLEQCTPDQYESRDRINMAKEEVLLYKNFTPSSIELKNTFTRFPVISRSFSNDWTLVDVSDADFDPVNNITISKNAQESILYLREFDKKAPTGQVMLASSEPPAPRLQGCTLASVSFRGSSIFHSVWALEPTPEKSLSPGLSGSWVINPSTGDIYGSLIAECLSLKMGYIFPITSIIEDIHQSIGSPVTLPTVQDTLRLSLKAGNIKKCIHIMASEENQDLLPLVGPVFTMEERTKILLEATKIGLDDLIMRILEYWDIDMNIVSEGRTVLSTAVEYGHESVVRMFVLKPGTNPDVKDSEGRTPLAYAAMKGYENIAAFLLDGWDINLNSQDVYHRTPLSLAAEGGHTSIIKLFLAQNTAVIKNRNITGRTPLFLGVAKRHEETTRLSPRDRIEVDMKDDSGRTPLSWAAQGGSVDVVKMLISLKDVNADSRDSNWRTPLSFAAQHGNIEVLKLLASTPNVDLDPKDRQKITPLCFGAANGHLAVVRFLAGNINVDINALDIGDWSPMHWAVQYSHKEVMDFLLPRMDFTKNIRSNQSLFKLAKRRGYPEVVQAITNHVTIGLNFGIQQDDGPITEKRKIDNEERPQASYQHSVPEFQVGLEEPALVT